MSSLLYDYGIHVMNEGLMLIGSISFTLGIYFAMILAMLTL